MSTVKLSVLHKAFLNELRALNKSNATITAYESDFKLVGIFLGKDDVREFRKERMRDFVSWLHAKGHTANGILRRVASTSSFGDWLEERGDIERNPMHKLRRPDRVKRPPKPVPTAQADQILERAALRVRAMVAIMRYAGLRVSELCALDLEDVGHDEAGAPNALRVQHGKGDKFRVVPILEQDPLVPILTAWLAERGTKDGPLFMNYRKQRLHRKGVAYLLNKLVGARGRGHVTPHMLRHTFGSEAIKKYDLVAVQELMGHADPTTTRGYIKLDVDDLRQSMKRGLLRSTLVERKTQ